MKKILLAVLVACLAAIIGSNTASADANNFTFSSFEADYYVNKDSEGRSTMTVKEQLVAEFPNFDQNHGIERAIPKDYDGHPVNLDVQSVTNGQGSSLNYTTYASGGNKVIRIGDADKYVYGQQTYRITYVMHDVTKHFETGDELYWDTNGTDWQQPFGSVTARIHIPETLAADLDGRTACYAGLAGRNDTSSCTIATTTANGETLIATSTTRGLTSNENLTYVIGFKANTFAAYVKPPMPLWQKILIPALLIAGIFWYLLIPIYVLIKGFRRWTLSGRDSQGKGTIVPEYLPPKNTSTLLSGVILFDRMPTKAVSAAIIDLAVRHYIKIYEVKKNEYELELVKSTEDLLVEEQQVVLIIFGSPAPVGTRVKLKDKTSTYKDVADLGKTVYEKAIVKNFMADTRASQKKINVAGGVLLGLGLLTLNVLGVIAGIVLLILGSSMPARTLSGVELKEYLLGLKEYMQMAEADRIKTLQSPQGASRTPIDTSDTTTLVKLYERLLPYAVLFGIEKDWAKQFAHLYVAPPDWYSGYTPTFNAVYFASALSSFSSSSINTFSPPSSSSSSGFSSGGGFSGGGGGGGGGGGW
jgi:uncharacterized membrane protein